MGIATDRACKPGLVFAAASLLISNLPATDGVFYFAVKLLTDERRVGGFGFEFLYGPFFVWIEEYQVGICAGA